ncbi:hypothetical protein QN277_024660 [Acacia crassicarpa]|uniref:Uncharacterized protein n=1 Tax=Acacia crassicarpa TaxID=499986 RepID=A0AAE1JCI3_9FABA|nr:hypothetical protein QN277_024660 [Acacia crassicarpa]
MADQAIPFFAFRLTRRTPEAHSTPSSLYYRHPPPSSFGTTAQPSGRTEAWSRTVKLREVLGFPFHDSADCRYSKLWLPLFLQSGLV